MLSSPYRVLDFGQVQVQLLVEALNEDNLKVHLDSETQRIRRLLAERAEATPRKAVIINDPSCNIRTTPTIRRLQADWMKDNRDLLRVVCHSMGMVLPGELARSALTAVLWLAPVPFPITVHESLEHALDWAIAEVDSIGGEIANELLLGGAMAVERARAEIERASRVLRSGAPAAPVSRTRPAPDSGDVR